MRGRRLLTAGLLLTLTGCTGTDAADTSGQTTAGSSTDSSSTAGSSSAAPSASTPAEQRIEVSVVAGQVSGDTGRVLVPLGNQVILVVTSDVPDEVHVHGYDLTAPLSPGTAELTIEASVPGVFEVELHEAGTVLLTLQVS